jgi:hypothetical protein
MASAANCKCSGGSPSRTSIAAVGVVLIAPVIPRQATLCNCGKLQDYYYTRTFLTMLFILDRFIGSDQMGRHLTEIRKRFWKRRLFYFKLICRHFTEEYRVSSHSGESVMLPILEREVQLSSLRSLVYSRRAQFREWVYLRDYPRWAWELKDTSDKINVLVSENLCELGPSAASPQNPDTFRASCARWQRLSS